MRDVEPLVLTYLRRLESASIQIMRAAVSEGERPVMLYSVGKESAAMLRAAKTLELNAIGVATLSTDKPIVFETERDTVRGIMAACELFEIHIDRPPADAGACNVKGLCKKARTGELADFTRISLPCEARARPEIHIDTTKRTPEQAAGLIVEALIP